MGEAQEALANLENLVEEAASAVGEMPPNVEAALENLASLEVEFRTEMRYVHSPDWEMKPGRMVPKKGTWLKKTTRFSWEVPAAEKLYVPGGISLPVLQVSRVVDAEEKKRHEWSYQHLRIWMKPVILRTLEERRNVWFVYWPHWTDKLQLVLAAAVDTWLKRCTGMSGDLQPFELIYVPKGMQLNLIRPPESVDDDWEKNRHGHVHQHRKVTLSGPPMTVRRDKHDILV